MILFLCAPTTLFTLLRQTGNENEYIYRFDGCRLAFILALAFLSSRYDDTRWGSINIYITNYTWKVRRNVFFMCLVIRLNQEYQINKVKERDSFRGKYPIWDAARCWQKAGTVRFESTNKRWVRRSKFSLRFPAASYPTTSILLLERMLWCSYLCRIHEHRCGNYPSLFAHPPVGPGHPQDGPPRRHRRKSYRKVQLHFLVEHLWGWCKIRVPLRRRRKKRTFRHYF